MQVLFTAWCDVLESKPARPKISGGLGGGGGPPPFANTIMTGSERVHMGSVFAGRMILEATLLSLKRYEDSVL